METVPMLRENIKDDIQTAQRYIEYTKLDITRIEKDIDNTDNMYIQKKMEIDLLRTKLAMARMEKSLMGFQSLHHYVETLC